MSFTRSVSWTATTLSDGTSFPAGMIMADCTVEERSDDESVITENPVEQGSVITDHAYELPSQLELSWLFAPGSSGNTAASPSYLSDTYQQLLNLKAARILLSISTGKRLYSNMLIKHIAVITGQKTENVLSIQLTLRQVIMAVTSVVSLGSPANMKEPGKTAPIINSGTVNPLPGNNFNPGTPPTA